MKKKPFINLSIRLRFIFMIMSELVCVSLISWLVMDVLHISDVPNIVWIILASVSATVVPRRVMVYRPSSSTVTW